MAFRNFFSAEDGAALIDWVALMAVLFGVTIGVVIAFGGSAETVGTSVGTTLDEMTVGGLPSDDCKRLV
jgi:Flp pilus assembly pilin Flp